MAYLLGIDIGTSGTKTVLFSEFGNAIASDTIEYPLYQLQNGYAEQEPLDWWNAVIGTIKNVLAKSGINSDDIKGVGLSGQMHGLVMLDEDGQVLRRSIIWCDSRTSKECEEITSKIGADNLISITANPALEGFTAGKILWVKNHEPQIYEKCKHILLPKDYIRYKLTGEFATEVSDASGMQLLDISKRVWSDEVLKKLDIDKSLLGKVYESQVVTGQITKSIAKLTGLKEGTIVVGGAGDNAAAAVGTGVVQDGKAFTTIGTSGVVYAHTSKLQIDSKGRVHTFCCAVPNSWHIMGVTQSAGLSLKWFRDNFCNEEILTAKSMEVDPYYLMDKEVESVEIGCNKLIYLPYLMGERTPHLDVNARGVFFGLSAIHTKKDLLRAVMEGVAFSQRDCMEVIKEMNINFTQMLACGGGGSSSIWRQMLADVYDLPVNTLQNKEGAALGAAILAGVGAGVYDSVVQACDNIIKINNTQNQISENVLKYDKYYNLYKEIYPSLKKQFKMLNEL